jgi:hypothetical protein
MENGLRLFSYRIHIGVDGVVVRLQLGNIMTASDRDEASYRNHDHVAVVEMGTAAVIVGKQQLVTSPANTRWIM